MDNDNINDPIFLKCYQNHRFSINWITFSPDSNYICSASDDSTLMLYSLDYDLLDKYDDHHSSNNSSNGSNEQLNRTTTTNCYRFIGHKDSVTSVSMNDNFIVSVSKDGTARLWRLDQLTLIDQLKRDSINESVQYRCHKSSINCVDINNNLNQFCTASDDQTIKIWSTTCANKLMHTLSGVHTNWIRHSRYSNLNTNLLSSCGDDGQICIWDMRTKEAEIQLKSKRKSTHFLGIKWHPTCEYILSSVGSDYLLRIWDLRYEKTIQFYQLHHNIVSSCDFHPNGQYLLTSSMDQTSKIIDVIEGKVLFTLKAHNGSVNCAQFSPNGKHFATAGQDRAILLWQCNFIEEKSSNDDDIGTITNFDSNHKTFTQDSKPKDLKNINENDLISNVNVATLSSSSSSSNVNVNVFKCILQQLETMTDSILQIDKRLTILENRFNQFVRK